MLHIFVLLLDLPLESIVHEYFPNLSLDITAEIQLFPIALLFMYADVYGLHNFSDLFSTPKYLPHDNFQTSS